MNKNEEERTKICNDIAIIQNSRVEQIKHVNLQKRKIEDLIAESLRGVKDNTIIVPIHGAPFLCSGPVAFEKKLKKRRQKKEKKYY